jgi:hypothetical protein
MSEYRWRPSDRDPGGNKFILAFNPLSLQNPLKTCPPERIAGGSRFRQINRKGTQPSLYAPVGK